MRRASVRAYAKINLSLEVLNKRPDGFHNLRTIFQTISLHDTIDIDVYPAARPRVELISDVEIPGENLIVRAALALFELTGASADVRFRLQKRIPLGGGLGGGSSDAAAVLMALPRMLDRTVDPRVLAGLGSRLGSDVPFFLTGGTAVGVARGTELYPLPDGRTWLGLLLAPAVHVSTADAYRLLGRTPNAPARLVSSPGERALTPAAGQEWGAACVNDFEEPVFGQHPELARLRARLAAAGATPARMTGSGSAIFGLFRTEDERSKAATAMQDVRAIPFEFVPRASYFAMSAPAGSADNAPQ